ncbi:transposon-transfer assisting family protein [uncultured Phascolarctobacterium sp.]|uniref:transposon-transfer assisting family protein n=1 Tax=uncultured Phascolarctobacterium sp. TaxID=512296 RepID=UPI00345437D4
MVHFTVEEENLVCVYYKADRRRTVGRMTAALPNMDGDMQVPQAARPQAGRLRKR